MIHVWDTAYSQLDDAIVQRGRHPRPDGVEGQALDPSRLGLELGQHGWWFAGYCCNDPMKEPKASKQRASSDRYPLFISLSVFPDTCKVIIR